jgi:uncharacterized protein (TIGR02646 family)
MVLLDRTGVVVPPKWAKKVGEKLIADYWAKAQAFERLALGDPVRLSGFGAYAPHVLVVTKAKADFPPLWRVEKYVKEEIAKMSWDNCAYCQSDAQAGQAGHVEHFRPKSLFPSLAYDWGNYFLGCERCNLTKSDKWPATGAFVRPDQGDPSARFVFDDKGGISPAPGDAEAQVTVQSLRLDRKGLSAKRKLLIARAVNRVKDLMAIVSDVPTMRTVVLKSLEPNDVPYSAAINQNVKRVWNAAYPRSPI